MGTLLHDFIHLAPAVQVLLISGIIWLMTLIALSRRAEENIACFFYDVLRGKRRPKPRRRQVKTATGRSEERKPVA